MIVQRCVLKRDAMEAERKSVHSTMMGSVHQDGTMGGNYSRNGSIMNGAGSMRGSNFQRGGSQRGSDRSIKSNKRDIDDIALSMHHMGGSQHLLASGYGRKDIDDMVRSKSYHFKRANSLQTDQAEQPHGIMILDDPGLIVQRHEQQMILNPQMVMVIRSFA
jgi:hypothetical protein